jgi:hypothetical protein
MNIEVYTPIGIGDGKKKILKKQLPIPPFRWILVGHSGSGKTNLIKNILYNDNFGYSSYFDYIFIICGSADDVDEYDRLNYKSKCKCYDSDKKQFSKKKMRVEEKCSVRQSTTNEELMDIIDELEHNEYMKGKKYLFVLDDMIVDKLLKNSVGMNAIDSLFIRGRHFGASTIISTQKYTALKQNLRTLNATNITLFNGIPKSNLKVISSEVAGAYEDEYISQIYNDYTREKFSYITINLKQSKDKYIQDTRFNYVI